MISRQDVEKFLIYKYGTDIFKYSGFKYVRDIIAGNEDYITGKIIQECNIIATEYDENFKTVMSAIRYFKEKVNDTKSNNTVFINNLIFEFKEWMKNKNETDRNV